mmetsp:Transcript_5047/g.8807  ORF Transcript_5047/g.8807 Transcript_5047/m.8807 type:complete len:82 (-) Transcript_5047:248-493(-)
MEIDRDSAKLEAQRRSGLSVCQILREDGSKNRWYKWFFPVRISAEPSGNYRQKIENDECRVESKTSQELCPTVQKEWTLNG